MIVVTDLDGTLLDHDSYSHQPADAVLNRLLALGIPLILNTSKTRAELRAIRNELGLDTPYIVENGGAICAPAKRGESVITLGAERSVIVAVLDRLRRTRNWPLRSYSEMSVQEVVSATGLSEAQARQSMARGYSEPLLWQGSVAELDSFSALIAQEGLQCVRGGRFIHLMGLCDKGSAMRELIERFYPDSPGPVVALGDSDNDVPMLRAADIGIAVRSPSKLNFLPEEGIIHTKASGPAGWAEALTPLLDQWENKHG